MPSNNLTFKLVGRMKRIRNSDHPIFFKIPHLSGNEAPLIVENSLSNGKIGGIYTVFLKKKQIKSYTSG